MAIIACKECGHQVSDKAASCPSCGAPIAVVVKPRGRAKRVIYGFLITSSALALIAAMLLLIRMPNRSDGAIAGFNHAAENFPAADSPAERPVATDQPSREAGAVLGAIYQTTAEQLYLDYGTNAVATQNRIGNSRVRVTGSVTEIDEDAFGHPIVKLWASDGQSVAMMLNDDQKSAAADLAKEEAIDIQCDKMRATAATPQGSGCAVVLVDATSKQAYLAVFFSDDKGIAPVYIVGPMSKAVCLARSDGISAQLNTDLKRDHVVSKNCAATARDSIPPQGCRLSSSMSSLPDMPAAHLWRYDCVAPGAASRRATETATARHKSNPGVVVMSIPAAPDVSTELEEAVPTSAAAATPGPSAAVQPAIPETPAAEAQKSALSVAAASVSPAPVAPAAPVAADKTPDSAGTTIPNDLSDVKVADPGAADHIATYCNTATAGVANQATVAAGCRHEEASAWTRLVLHNEFPTLDEATRQKCNAPPFPDSYVAKETCAKYQLRIN